MKFGPTLSQSSSIREHSSISVMDSRLENTQESAFILKIMIQFGLFLNKVSASFQTEILVILSC